VQSTTNLAGRQYDYEIIHFRILLI